MEEVRVCRFCGHIDAASSTGRCSTCGLFFELAIVSRAEAEQLVRRRRRRLARRHWLRLLVGLALVGGVTVWAGRVFFDLGLTPPRATTSVSASSAPHTWSQGRRSAHNSGFIPDPAPFPPRLKWTYRTAQPLLASPAVVEPHVYLSTGDGRSIALDRHTGQPMWEDYSGWPSSSTPAVAADMVIVALRPGRVMALERQSGRRRWETDLKHPLLASPLVAQGSVYIGAADKHLYALDAASGQQRWAFAAKDWIVSAIAYADARVVVASQHSRIHVVGADTGRQRLVYDTGMGRHIGAGLAIHGDRAYFGSFGGRVWAIDWRATTYPWEPMLSFWKTNLFLWGMLAKPPVQKGSVWSRNVGGDVLHTPAIAHDMVYVATSHQKVMALDTVTGATRWVADLGVDITAAPTVAGTAVLIGTRDGVVFGLEAYTGEVLWEFKTAGKIVGSPIVAGDTMYVASFDGTLYAVTRGE